KRVAQVIHIDPRFTRTSAVADKHITIRAGTDIVLLGALINHMIQNDLWFKEYVLHYTNAAQIISEGFAGPEDLDGLFSGYDDEIKGYNNETWQYEEDPESADGIAKDMTLQHPRTVFQILKRHYSRYTPEAVEDMCGIKPDAFRYLADAIAENSGREKTMTM